MRVVIALIVLTSLAHADDARKPEVTWGVTGAEVGMATTFALAFSSHAKAATSPGGLVALTLGTFALGGGLGYLAYKEDLSATPPLVLHGAAWVGLDMFLVGALIDGRDRRSGLRAGKTAFALGAVGAIGGGLLASRSKTATSDAVWLVAPGGGFIVGGLVGGVAMLIAFKDKPSWAAIGALSGGVIGAGVASFVAQRNDDPNAASRTAPLMLSYGGIF